MFRRSALDTVGTIYRPGMNFCEDWDLFVRLASAGWGNIYSDSLLSSYRVWTDAVGYRAGRKLIELDGLRQLFDDTLTPAFRERGWPDKTLLAARQRLACSQVRSLLVVPKTSPDYAAVTQSLLNLGDCAGLRWRINIIKYGGGRLLDLYANLLVKLKDRIKSIIRLLPSQRP